jgi:hypothetical protein
VTTVIVLGALIVAAGLAWRAAAARTERARIALTLASSDPTVRSIALRRISRSGLTPHAATLLSLTSTVDDPARLGELAWLVASTQWEPARDPRIAQLRLWADGYYRAARPPVPDLRSTSATPVVHPLPAPQIGPPGPSGGPIRRATRPPLAAAMSVPSPIGEPRLEETGESEEVSARPTLPGDAQPTPALVAAIEAVLGEAVMHLDYQPFPAAFD